MNDGWFGGLLVDSVSGHRIPEALVSINHIQGDTRILQLYNPKGFRSSNLFTTSQEDGVWGLPFQWSGTELGEAAGATLRLNVMRGYRDHGAMEVNRYGAPRRFTLRTALVVSLRAVADGALPDPRSGTNLVGMAVDAYMVVRKINLPRLPALGRPSPEYYAMFGFYRLAV